MGETALRIEPILTPHYNFVLQGEGLPVLFQDATQIAVDRDCWLLARFWTMPVACPWHDPLEVYQLRQVWVEDGLAVAATCCGYPVAWQAETEEPALAGLVLGAQTDFYRRWAKDAGLTWRRWRAEFLGGEVLTTRFAKWLDFMADFELAQLAGEHYRITQDGRCLVGAEAVERFNEVDAAITEEVCGYHMGIQRAYSEKAPLEDEGLLLT